jgi:DNA-binding transcriptional regulator YdaS (Cro superfamily)
METPGNIVDRVIAKLGGLTKATAALELNNPSIIANWRTRGRVPAGRVLDVERVTGISRHKLRPDVFGNAENAA